MLARNGPVGNSGYAACGFALKHSSLCPRRVLVLLGATDGAGKNPPSAPPSALREQGGGAFVGPPLPDHQFEKGICRMIPANTAAPNQLLLRNAWKQRSGSRLRINHCS